MSFLSTYSALRFAGGRKAPGVVGPLLKAAGLILVIAVALPLIAIQFLLSLQVRPAPVPVRRPRGAERGAFQSSIDDLTEVMK